MAQPKGCDHRLRPTVRLTHTHQGGSPGFAPRPSAAYLIDLNAILENIDDVSGRGATVQILQVRASGPTSHFDATRCPLAYRQDGHAVRCQLDGAVQLGSAEVISIAAG